MSVFKSINPYSEELIYEFELDNLKSLSNKLDNSQKAFLQWSSMQLKDRLNLLHGIPVALELNKLELAKLISTEMGKPIIQSEAEIAKCMFLCQWYLEHATNLYQDQEILLNGDIAKIINQPLGGVLGIMPWNYPFWQVFRYALPALIAGNTILLKHAPNVQGCANAITEIFSEAIGDNGTFVNLIIDVKRIESVIASSAVAGVSFTGSSKAGKSVAALAGKYMKPSTMELGGSDPFIVFPDADLDLAVQDALNSRMKNSGQSCIAAKRIIVHAEIYDQFKNRLLELFSNLKIGDPLDDKTNIGPLARLDLKEHYDYQVSRTFEMGAHGVSKPDIPEKGFFGQPVVFDNIPINCPASSEEIFGPAFSLFKAVNSDDAIAIANNSKFGLGASIYTADRKEAFSLSKRLESGTVAINQIMATDPRVPFGGIKSSGYGRELGREGLLHFTNRKAVFL